MERTCTFDLIASKERPTKAVKNSAEGAADSVRHFKYWGRALA